MPIPVASHRHADVAGHRFHTYPLTPRGLETRESRLERGLQEAVRAHWDHPHVTATDDVDALAAVARILRELAGRAPVPTVVLTDAPVSSYRHSGRRTWLEISRGALRRPVRVLRAELAHEYAHSLIAKTWLYGTWRRLAFLAMFTGAGVGFAGVVVAAVGSDAVVAPAGWVLTLVGVCALLRQSRWCEYRADALAARLVGDRRPLLEWLAWVEARHREMDPRIRLASYATHPSPTRRLRKLLGSAGERISDARCDRGGSVSSAGGRHDPAEGHAWGPERRAAA